MDTWAFVIIGVGVIGWWASKKNQIFVFIVGVGVGLLAGAIWAAVIVNSVLR